MARKVSALREEKELRHPTHWNVDTYARPQAPAMRARPTFQAPDGPAVLPQQQLGGGGWGALAEGLSALSPGLNQFLGHMHKVWTEDESAKAKEAYERNQMGWAELIKENPELRSASPHFRREYHSAELRAKARTFQNELLQEFNSNPGGLLNQDDPEVVNAWIQQKYVEFLDANTEGLDPILFQENVAGRFEQLREGLLDQHAKVRSEEYTRGVRQGVVSDTTNAIVNSLGGEGSPGTLEDSQALGSMLAGIADHYIERGLLPKESNAMVAQAVMQWAEETNNPEIIDILNHIPTGTGFLGGVPEVKAEAIKLKHRLDERLYTLQQRERQQQKWAEEERDDRMVSDAMAALIDNDPKTAAGLVNQLLENSNWRYANQLQSFIKQYEYDLKKGTEIDDKATMVNLMRGWFMQPDATATGMFFDAVGAYERGLLKPDTMVSLMGNIQKIRDTQESQHFSQADEVFKAQSRVFTRNVVDAFGRRFEGVSQHDEQIALAQAQEFEFVTRQMYHEWVQANRKDNPAWQPTMLQVQEKIDQIVQTTMKNPRFHYMNREADLVPGQFGGRINALERTQQIDQISQVPPGQTQAPVVVPQQTRQLVDLSQYQQYNPVEQIIPSLLRNLGLDENQVYQFAPAVPREVWDGIAAMFGLTPEDLFNYQADLMENHLLQAQQRIRNRE